MIGNWIRFGVEGIFPFMPDLDFQDGFDDFIFHASFGSDENFLESLLRLGDGFDAAGDFPLDFHCASSNSFAKRLSAVGSADDDADHAMDCFNFAHHQMAFF